VGDTIADINTVINARKEYHLRNS